MTCPCGAGESYEACCGRYIGTDMPAPTAEALMRSRYSAYVKGEVRHIFDTQDPSTGGDQDPDATEAWSKQSNWLGLEVRSVEAGGEHDATGAVEFVASYEVQGQRFDHHELATFRRRGDRWYYLDGKVRGPEPIRREGRKIGPNEPCPCGSGKKYKKCCKRAGREA